LQRLFQRRNFNSFGSRTGRKAAPAGVRHPAGGTAGSSFHSGPSATFDVLPMDRSADSFGQTPQKCPKARPIKPLLISIKSAFRLDIICRKALKEPPAISHSTPDQVP
jgi:hypothetical protein